MRYKVRPEKLASFGRAPLMLFAALRQFPKKMWLYECAPHLWSIHKTILHLADTEASAYLCCRRYIAEQGSLDSQFDSDRWAESLGYHHQSPREALEIYRRLRKTTYQLIVTLQEVAIASEVERPIEGGPSLDAWLEDQESHILRHITQMNQIYDMWRRTHLPRKPASHSRRSNIASPTLVLHRVI